MAKVLKRELAWLARDTPGFNVFRPKEASQKTSSPQKEHRYDGPHRRVAHRGTELFVATGTELRWSDIALMRDAGEDHRHAAFHQHEQQDTPQVYRVLQTPVARPIRQLSISPGGDYIAIATDYTCHVATLPSSTHLRSGDFGPLRLKAFQLGPTAHVVEKAPLMSVIWHPLAPTGNCLVTVAKDSCVRMWELDRDNRDTFSSPSLAVDLRKLSNAASQLDNFSTSTWGTSAGYSPDSEEMQVAGACFGGQGHEDEHGWGSMTLWIAMTEGGVYALCPFLPERWRAPATILPSLTTSVVSKARAISRANHVSEVERRVSEQQRRWLADVDAQEPLTIPGEHEFDVVEIYARPERPGAIPKLQGPYFITPDADIGDITDIHVIAPKIDDDELYDDDEFAEAYSEDALSVGIVCLSNSRGRVHVCLDLNDVQAEWLPPRRPRGFTFEDSAAENDLVLLETVDPVSSNADSTWSTLTISPTDRYELFTTQRDGVYALSFRPWISRLETELSDPSGAGADFRFNLLLESAPTVVTQPIQLQSDDANAVVAVADPAEGYVLLTVASDIPHSALLEPPAYDDIFAPDEFTPTKAIAASEFRPPYQADDRFFKPSALPPLIKDAANKRVLGSDLKSQVRFSAATLQLMTEAHRILSNETHELGEAASALFVRVSLMREELHEQIRQVREIAQRVDGVRGGGHDGQEGKPISGKEKTDARVASSKQKTLTLNQRVDALRKKILHLGGSPLSARERAFADEVKTLDSSISGAPPAAPTDAVTTLSLEDSWMSQPDRTVPSNTTTLATRLEAASSLRESLLGQADAIAGRQSKEDGRTDNKKSIGSGGHFRRQKIEEVQEMLEVETALVEAVRERLDRLSRD